MLATVCRTLAACPRACQIAALKQRARADSAFTITARSRQSARQAGPQRPPTQPPPTAMAAPAAAPAPAKVDQANAPVISLANFEER